MRGGRVERKGAFTKMPAEVIAQVRRESCSLWTCAKKYDLTRIEHIHHLLPRRWLNARGIYEHSAMGLLSICEQCHGRAKTVEDCLFRGDLLGFMQGMNRLGFPMDRIRAFARSVGLEEFDRWQN